MLLLILFWLSLCSFFAILFLGSACTGLAQLLQPIDQVGRAQMEMGSHAPGEQSHMGRGDQFRAGGVAQFAHDAFEEGFARLTVAACRSLRNTILDGNALGTCLVAAVAMPAARRFRKNLVEARMNIPAILEIADFIMVLGRRCRRQEYDFDVVLDEGLAGEARCPLLPAPHHDAR